MRRRNTVSRLTLFTALTIFSGLGGTVDLPVESSKPHLKDWFWALWFNNLIKIPLSIDVNSLWYANLSAVNTNGSGTVQDGGKCMVDNNGATTIIFPTDKTTADPWYDKSKADA